MGVMLNNVKSTTRILQRKIGKVPKNTISTTKISYVRELTAIIKQHKIEHCIRHQHLDLPNKRYLF